MDQQATPIVTRQELCRALGRLGIVPGDIVLMHSSLSSLGRMEDGPDGVIDALLSSVGPSGHLLVPTHTSCSVHPGRPIDAFNPQTTPSKTGRITEVLRTRPEARRSGHPTHSLAALGPRAAELVAGHDLDGGTFNITGPHGRYVRWNAKILFLGVTLSSNTTYHAVEEWLALPYMPDTKAAVVGQDGQPRIVIVNSPCGHRNFYRNAGLNLPNPVTDALGPLLASGQCGPAELLLVWARDVVRVTTQCELASPGSLLCEQPDCMFCRLARHHCILRRAETAELGRELLARPELCDPKHPRAE